MNSRTIGRQRSWAHALVRATVVSLLGLALLFMPVFDGWVSASYDSLFRFQSRLRSNDVVIVLMDNEAHVRLHQSRGQWERKLHAQLANKLADDDAALVVFDVFFEKPDDPDTDHALASSLQRCRKTVLMAWPLDAARPEAAKPGFDSLQAVPPAKIFLEAAGNHTGLGTASDDDRDAVVRRHWPFPAPSSGLYESLPWVAARLAGARLPETPCKQWLRYYGRHGAWNALSFHSALDQPKDYFHDKIVFIGNKVETSIPDNEKDKFRTPYTARFQEASSGVEILATTFLNLLYDEWLERFPEWMEAFLLILTGVLLGAGLSLQRRSAAGVIGLAILAVAATIISADALTRHSRYWFPWLVVVGGQVPCALALSLYSRGREQRAPESRSTLVDPVVPHEAPPVHSLTPAPEMPDAPGYELIQPPFGTGGYGRVWLARNVAGQWQALKAIYLAKFENSPEPYDREFRGITRFKPLSKGHPGLLEVDYISPKKPEGYFYYVMELGDSLTPGWEAAPTTYRPRDLMKMRDQHPQGRLPVRECVRIGLALADTLEFLHGRGLTHRDIKPSNVIFVNNRPKLADVGLLTEEHPGEQHSLVGTVGYMPPPPEPPGTPAADIYALGMVLYVISTGQESGLFPTLSTTLVHSAADGDYLWLNPIILKACQPDRSRRYATVGELKTSLAELARQLGPQPSPELS